MKKILAAVLSVILICSVGGCGKAKPPTDGSSETPTLTWYVPGDKQSDIKEVMEAANKIISPVIGAKLDMQFIDTGSFTEKMNMNMSAGTVFDMCFTGFVNPYETTAKKGGYQSLNNLLKTTPDLKKSIPDYLWEASKINGEIYAVPNYQVVSGFFTPFVFTDIVEKLKLDLSNIKTMDDLEPILAKIKNEMPEVYPWRNANGMLWSQNTMDSITNEIYIRSYDDSLKAYTVLDSDDTLYTAKKIRSWYEKGYIRSDVASVGDDNLDWVNGKYAIFQTTYKPGIEAELKAKFGGREVTPIFIGKPFVTRAKCLATMIAVSRTCKHPKQAIKLIELMNTNNELYNLISFGIEGRHYEKMDLKHIRLKKDSGYYVNAAWKFGNQFHSYLLEGMNENVWEDTIRMNNEAQKSQLLGFVLDTTPISSEISQVNAASSEFGALFNGAIDPEDCYEQYKRKLLTAGIEKLRDEIQRQLNEYKKSARP